MSASLSPVPGSDPPEAAHVAGAIDGADAISLGTVLDDRYRIEGVLGRGGMGMVYRAEHLGLGRKVAVKVLHADLGHNRDAAARFQREALASGRLDHPNIVVVTDFGVLDGGACYLVMEQLEGEPLGERIERAGPMPWRAAARVMREVLDALRHAHERGVVHRDIKPDNIFIAYKDGVEVVKLVDFGIAKLSAGRVGDPASTRSGMTVGTPAYLSPEQAVGGEITPASDLYSATIVLFELLTGGPPFWDDDPVALLTSHVGKPVPTLRGAAPGIVVPDALEALIADGLAKLTRDRIPSASAYLARLDAALAEADAEGAAGVGEADGEAAASGPAQDPAPSAPAPSAPPASALTASASEFRDAPSVGDVYEPLPKAWLRGGAAAIGGTVVVALVLAILHWSGGDRSGAGAPRAGAPAKVTTVTADARGPGATAAGLDAAPLPVVVSVPVPTPVVTVGPPPTETPLDRDIRLKAAYHDLETGPTCAARRGAVGALRALGDPRAIPALRSARYRMRGGILGIGDENTNGCLRADAEAAIRALTPPKPPAPAPAPAKPPARR